MDRNKQFYIALAVFASVVLSSFLGIRLLKNLYLTNIQDDYTEARATLVELEQKKDLLTDLRATYNDISEGAEDISGALLSKDQTLDVLEALDVTASNTGTQYEVTTINEIKSDDRTERIDLNITAEGEFVNIMSFLRDVQNMDFITHIPQLSVNRANDSAIRTTFTLSVFVK